MKAGESIVTDSLMDDRLEPDVGTPKALIGASIPRSGHHYLQRMLTLYYGSELFYCEVYSQRTCCKQVPCTRRGGHAITYQKSHDRDFSLTRDVEGALYIVQYRHPVPEAISDRELDLRDGLGRRSLNYRLSRDYYAWWLAAKAIYYRKFHDKWFVNRVENGVYLDYDALAKGPEALVTPMIRWASGSVDEARLAEAIEQASSSRAATRAGASTKSFVPRVAEESPHFDRALLAPFEAYVLRHCPAFGFEAELAGDADDPSLLSLILIQDPEEPLPEGEEDRLDAAARRVPDHPEIALRLAKREFDRDDAEQAIAILAQLLERNPFFGPAYKLLTQACKKAGQPLPSSSIGSDALFACAESPSTLVDVATAMLAQDMVVNAIAALSVAVVLEPNNFRANHTLARILAKEGKWGQAKAYAERARVSKPENKVNQRLLARIGQHVPLRRKARLSA